MMMLGDDSVNFQINLDDSVGITSLALKHLEQSSSFEIKKKDKLRFKVIVSSDHKESEVESIVFEIKGEKGVKREKSGKLHSMERQSRLI